MPEISVIVPVYKVEPYLRKCVDSILAQTFQDFELILVDDGSPDQCGAICEEYARKCGNVIALHRENGGLSAARNTGIDWAMEHSDSRWLAFVDSDDYVHSDYLKRMYEDAKEKNADLVVCDFVRVDEAETTIEEEHRFSELLTDDKQKLFEYLNSDWRIRPSWNKLYKKTLFADLRFAVGKIHEDEFIIHHILWKCCRISIIDAGLYYYRTRANSIVATETAKSRLDGFEAVIEQCEFSLAHNLPLNAVVVYTDYINSFMDMKQAVDGLEKARYKELKKRYAKVYFSKKSNRRPASWLRFWFNGAYRKMQSALGR